MSCVTAEGYKKAAEILRDKRFDAMLIRQITPVLAATDAAANMLDIASKKNAIADRQVSLAEAQLAQAQLAWPCEENQISESNTALDPYEARYDQEVNKAGIAIKAAFGDKRQKLMKSFNRYSTGAKTNALKRLCLAEEIAVGDAMLIAHIGETDRIRTYDDRDFNRKLGVAGMGKNIANQAGSYLSGAAASSGDLSGSVKAFTNAIGMFEQNYAQYTSASPFVQQTYLQEAANAPDPYSTFYDMGEVQSPADGVGMPDAMTTEMSGANGTVDDFSLFYSGDDNQAVYPVEPDSTVKSVHVVGKDSRGDRIDITVGMGDITYTNANDSQYANQPIEGY